MLLTFFFTVSFLLRVSVPSRYSPALFPHALLNLNKTQSVLSSIAITAVNISCLFLQGKILSLERGADSVNVIVRELNKRILEKPEENFS